MESVETPTIGTITLRRHALDVQASRLTALARRVELRLRHALDANPTWFPDEPWVELAKWYQRTVATMLMEQRARAQLAKDRPPLTDAELEGEMAKLAADLVLSMPAEKLRALLEQRGEQPSARPEMVDLPVQDVKRVAYEVNGSEKP